MAKALYKAIKKTVKYTPIINETAMEAKKAGDKIISMLPKKTTMSNQSNNSKIADRIQRLLSGGRLRNNKMQNYVMY